MNRTCTLLLGIGLATAADSLHAGSRVSASYTIVTDATDVGGRPATSASYNNVGSVSPLAGTAGAASPPVTTKAGYAGQIVEVKGLVLNSATPSVNETAMLQFGAWQILDDLTYLAVSATGVTWSVVTGPVTGISTVGIATAGVVYQNTPATVQGTFGGFIGSLNITVRDTVADNFGTYAGDDVGDDWQVQYFGQNNPNAGPNVDFDGTGQSNLFKYIAGLNPLDPNARFTLAIAPVPGQPGQKKLTFSPRFTDRTYTIKAKSSLLSIGGWTTIVGSTPSDNGTERTITDPDASGPAKFYRVEITKP